MPVVPPPAVESALDAVGNTPVVRLCRVVPEGHAQVFVKLEYSIQPAPTRTGWPNPWSKRLNAAVT